MNGHKQTEESKKKISNKMRGKKNALGHKLSKEHKEKIRNGSLGEKSHNWKGENVGYRGLHQWVVRKLGKATKCSNCNKEGNGHEIHWANIDHKYRRIKEDYFQACSKCHGEYDKNNNLRIRKEVVKY